MNPEVLLAEKMAVSACIGLLIGLEREWRHMELGVRSFTIVALLGTLSWVVSPTFAVVEVGIVAVIIVLANVHLFLNKKPVELTTALALGVTNVLGVLIGGGYFFLPLASAIVMAALLSWKNELVEFTSKLTLAEIRGTLLMAFIAAVVYPLLPATAVDPWKIIIPRSIWLTVIVVSGLSFINYVLLRQYGVKGMRYSAILGGFVNSAAVSIMLGNHLKTNPDTSETVPTNFLLGDLAMIFRNGLLVVIFSWPAGPATTYAVLYVIGPMILLAAFLALFSLIRSAKTIQQTSQDLGLRSPLSLRSVFRFAVLFFTLSVLSGIGELLFGSIGFLVVVVVGATASAASSAVLVGTHVSRGLISPGIAVLAVFLATVVGLVENVVIMYSVSRNRAVVVRLSLFTLPIVLVGGLALVMNLLTGW